MPNVGSEQISTIGEILKQQRTSIPMTLQKLAKTARVSASHLGRIERGERFPSGRILRKIAGPLGFEEKELFTLAGYLTSQSVSENGSPYLNRQLDPVVARLLSQEPVQVQRQVVSILAIMKSLAKVSDGNPEENKQT